MQINQICVGYIFSLLDDSIRNRLRYQLSARHAVHSLTFRIHLIEWFNGCIILDATDPFTMEIDLLNIRRIEVVYD